MNEKGRGEVKKDKREGKEEWVRLKEKGEDKIREKKKKF